MSEEKKRFHLNWVDIVIIVVVLALAAAAILVRNMITGEEQRETYTMRFTAEAQRIELEVAESFKMGEDIYDSSTNEYLGTVVGLDIHPHRHIAYSDSTGKYTDCDDPLLFDIEIEVEGQGYVDDKDVRMENKVLKIGAPSYLKGKGHAVSGYVVEINTMDAPVPAYSNKGSGSRQITYQILVSDIRMMSVESFKKGETLFEKSTGGLLGVIQDITYEPFRESKPYQNSVIVAEKPGRYAVTLTMQAMCNETDKGYFIDGITELKVGSKSGDIEKNGIVLAGRYQQTSMEYINILKVE